MVKEVQKCKNSLEFFHMVLTLDFTEQNVLAVGSRHQPACQLMSACASKRDGLEHTTLWYVCTFI